MSRGKRADAPGQQAKAAVAMAREAGVDLPRNAQGVAASAIARGADAASVFAGLMMPDPDQGMPDVDGSPPPAEGDMVPAAPTGVETPVVAGDAPDADTGTAPLAAGLTDKAASSIPIVSEDPLAALLGRDDI